MDSKLVFDEIRFEAARTEEPTNEVGVDPPKKESLLTCRGGCE